MLTPGTPPPAQSPTTPSPSARSRFAPVKGTADLLALRSDAYEIHPDGQVRLHPDRHGVPPVITLCDDYKLVDQLDSLGVPGLRRCRSLTITGPAHFPPGAVLEGDVTWSGPWNGTDQSPA